MIDGTMIGQVAAKMMERLDVEHEDDNPKLIEVMIIAEVECDKPDNGERGTQTETQCSSDRVTVQSGLMCLGQITLDETE